MSLEGWNNFWQWSSAIAAGVTFVAGAGAIITGNRLSDRQRAELVATQRAAAEANNSAAQAGEHAAAANERAGRLELEAAAQRERAAKAERDLLELQKRTSPRQLNRDAFLRALEGQPKLPVQILYLRDDPDSFRLSIEIREALRTARWSVTEPEPIPVSAAPPRSGPAIPTTMSVGGQPSGITVVAHSLSEREMEAVRDRILGRDWVKTPWTVLRNAFLESMGSVNGSANSMCPRDALRVVIGPK